MNLIATIPAGKAGVTVNGLHQWDYGRKLEIHAADLPSVIEIHFACAGMPEAVVRSCAVVNGVATATVPDECLEQTSPIFAWIYIIEGTTGLTTKTVVMPVTPRTKPQPGATVPEEHADKYTQLITEVNQLLGELKNGAITASYADRAGEAVHAESADEAVRATNALALHGGVALAANTDLNSCIAYGNYYVPDNETAHSLLNAPAGVSAGSLRVISGVGGTQDVVNAPYLYLLQIYTVMNGSVHIRALSRENGAWAIGRWVQAAGEGSKASTADYATRAQQDQNGLTIDTNYRKKRFAAFKLRASECPLVGDATATYAWDLSSEISGYALPNTEDVADNGAVNYNIYGVSGKFRISVGTGTVLHIEVPFTAILTEGSSSDLSQKQMLHTGSSGHFFECTLRVYQNRLLISDVRVYEINTGKRDLTPSGISLRSICLHYR